MLIPTLLVSLLAQGPGLTANIDDPASHGVVGDSLLSLDEAIRLANGTLNLTALSAAEQARVSGTGTAVTEIVVDAAITPTITLSAPLTELIGPGPATGRLMLRGVAAAGARPTLEAGTEHHALRIARQMVDVMGFDIHGGERAVVAQMTMAMGTPFGAMAMVRGCHLDGQSVAGVELLATGMEMTMLMVRDSSLTNMPLGFRIDDQAMSNMLMSENERVTFDGVDVGCHVQEGGAGMMSMWFLFRSKFDNGEKLCEVRRTAGSTKQFMVRVVHTDATCSGDVIDAQGIAGALTMVHTHHGDFVAGAGHKAYHAWPRTADFDLHGSEMTFVGDVLLSANLASPRIWQQNCRFVGGTVTYDVDGALPNLLWNRYEQCAIVVPSTARSPVTVRQSQFDATTVDGQSFLAPVSMQGCYRVGGTMNGFVTETAPAPAEFLGTTTVTPPDPQLGASIDLSTDLPYGIAMIWDIANSYARPTTTDEPFRFYGDPASVIVLPAVVLFQSTITVPVPANPGLAGLEFYVQGISLPLLGQSYAPAYHLPRGGLVLLRN